MKRRWNGGVMLTIMAALVAVVALAVAPEEPPGGGAELAATAPSAEDGAAQPEDGPPAPAEAAGGDSARGPAGAGIRVHLDPETGELRSRPARPLDEEAEPRAPSSDERWSTYGGDLIEERLEDGGFKVDLRGRFHSSVVATIDPETDEVTIDCVKRPAAVPAEDESEAGDDG